MTEISSVGLQRVSHSGQSSPAGGAIDSISIYSAANDAFCSVWSGAPWRIELHQESAGPGQLRAAATLTLSLQLPLTKSHDRYSSIGAASPSPVAPVDLTIPRFCQQRIPLALAHVRTGTRFAA